ncbi:MAG: [FeFe] hydrogenase H-cluster maturation GTPase HydF, partial [Oscillospiraceae bacterium]
VALTSPIAGTTTDPVFKPMELLPLGPVVFNDTAGLDDVSELGELRVKKTMAQLDACDAAILVLNSKTARVADFENYVKFFIEKQIQLLIVVNKFEGNRLNFDVSKSGFPIVQVDLMAENSAEILKKALIIAFQDKVESSGLTNDLVKSGDIVLLVMPQDIQAPKGRLILPQVQVTRDLLDNGCMVISVTANAVKSALNSLKEKPSIVITDSQIFKQVNEQLPSDIKLTSFSMLMAKNKGDILQFIDGARAIDRLCDGDKVLIIESCSHHSLEGDIARTKLPNLLKKYTGKALEITNISGQKFPENLSEYKLAIHCGGCMINKKTMLSKQENFAKSYIPLTNFGVAIAYMNGIIDRVCY